MLSFYLAAPSWSLFFMELSGGDFVVLGGKKDERAPTFLAATQPQSHTGINTFDPADLSHEKNNNTNKTRASASGGESLPR